MTRPNPGLGAPFCYRSCLINTSLTFPCKKDDFISSSYKPGSSVCCCLKLLELPVPFRCHSLRAKRTRGPEASITPRALLALSSTLHALAFLSKSSCQAANTFCKSNVDSLDKMHRSRRCLDIDLRLLARVNSSIPSANITGSVFLLQGFFSAEYLMYGWRLILDVLSPAAWLVRLVPCSRAPSSVCSNSPRSLNSFAPVENSHILALQCSSNGFHNFSSTGIRILMSRRRVRGKKPPCGHRGHNGGSNTHVKKSSVDESNTWLTSPHF